MTVLSMVIALMTVLVFPVGVSDALAAKDPTPGCGGDGKVFIVDRAGVPHRWSGGRFVKMPGKADHISVDANGRPWIVAKTGRISFRQ